MVRIVYLNGSVWLVGPRYGRPMLTRVPNRVTSQIQGYDPHSWPAFRKVTYYSH